MIVSPSGDRVAAMTRRQDYDVDNTSEICVFFSFPRDSFNEIHSIIEKDRAELGRVFCLCFVSLWRPTKEDIQLCICQFHM